jgi:Skp family chaperone for outer membrane proteins
MKKVFFTLLAIAGLFFAGDKASAQVKVGVFDLDYMVTAMPGYRTVDSLLNIYSNDSLAAEYQVYVSEYKRLDSTIKADSAAGKPAAVIKYNKDKLAEIYPYLVNWSQYAQQKLSNKKGILAQGLYQQVQAAYIKVLDAKKYNIVLKPGAYEFGPRIDNLFISVAKELKLTELPQELLVLGVDPDAPAQGQAPASGAAKPAGAGGGAVKKP